MKSMQTRRSSRLAAKKSTTTKPTPVNNQPARACKRSGRKRRSSNGKLTGPAGKPSCGPNQAATSTKEVQEVDMNGAIPEFGQSQATDDHLLDPASPVQLDAVDAEPPALVEAAAAGPADGPMLDIALVSEPQLVLEDRIAAHIPAITAAVKRNLKPVIFVGDGRAILYAQGKLANEAVVLGLTTAIINNIAGTVLVAPSESSLEPFGVLLDSPAGVGFMSKINRANGQLGDALVEEYYIEHPEVEFGSHLLDFALESLFGEMAIYPIDVEQICTAIRENTAVHGTMIDADAACEYIKALARAVPAIASDSAIGVRERLLAVTVIRSFLISLAVMFNIFPVENVEYWIQDSDTFDTAVKMADVAIAAGSDPNAWQSMLLRYYADKVKSRAECKPGHAFGPIVGF